MIFNASRLRKFLLKYRPLLGLGAAALLAELAYAILNLSALPMYVKFELNSEKYWGFILSTFLLTEAISRPAFGALGDKIGRKPLMIAGPALTCLTSYLTIIYSGPYVILWLFALRAMDGLGSGALWPSAFAAVGDITEEENRSTAMSMLNVTYMSGLALGFLMGGAVNEYFHSLTASFYLTSILLLMSVIVMIFFIPSRLGIGHSVDLVHGEPLELPIETPASFKWDTMIRSFRDVPDMITLAVVSFLGMGMLTPIVKLYAIEHLGLSETQFGILVAPIAAAMGIFAVPMGRVGDKYGKCLAVSWGLLVSAVAMWVLAIFRSIILAGIAGIVIGLGFTMAFPAWNALVLSVTRPDRRGEVIGAVGLAQGLAAIVGASLGAYIYGSDLLSFPRLGVVNYNVPFWFSAILLSISAVMCFTWIRNKHCHRDPGKSITTLQKNIVVIGSIIGLISLVTWITYRYTLPVPPDRVAWCWVQQLVRGRPDKAIKYTLKEVSPNWDPIEVTKRKSEVYKDWRTKRQGRYTVYHGTVYGGKADVPVVFVLKGGKIIEEHILLCRKGEGEWKVCGIYTAK